MMMVVVMITAENMLTVMKKVTVTMLMIVMVEVKMMKKY
jgi:hypothetical protein